MIEKVRVRNYKALRDVEVSLGPINLLIGPNDSGKTSFLEAIGAMCRSVDQPLSSAFAGSWSGLDLVSDRDPEKAVELEGALAPPGARIEYGFSCTFRPLERKPLIQTEWVFSDDGPRKDLDSRNHSDTLVKRVAADNAAGGDAEVRGLVKRLHRELHGVQNLHLDPRMLALPVAPDSTRSFRLDPSGFGLARCLDEILGVDREQFARIEEGLRTIFPSFRSIRLEPQSAFRAAPDVTRDVPEIRVADGKGIELAFDGAVAPVPAPQVSDGILMLIAYLTVLNLPTPPRLLLVEEPENGIHPRRLQESSDYSALS